MSGRKSVGRKHAALAFAEPERRKQVAQVLLDHMRRELVIDVSYLDKDKQDSLREKSRQRLIEPWALDENEELSYAYVLLPRPRIRDKEGGGFLFFSPRGGYGQYCAAEIPSRLQEAADP
jgi:hypothetical protein